MEPIYVAIPGYPNYEMTRDGLVRNVTTGELLLGSVNPAGYHNFRITDEEGICLTWGRHRLLAWTFMHPGCAGDLVVNHKNGIKGDDRLDNLEWVTHQENCEHAGNMGLSPKCTPVSVRWVDSGDVEHYPSMIECARNLGMTKDAVSYRVHKGDSRIFPERRQYRFLSENYRPWYTPTFIECQLAINGRAQGVLMRVLETGEVLEFSQQAQLAKHLKVSPATITTWMKLPDQPVLPGYIQLKWQHDEAPWREVEDRYVALSRFTGKPHVIMTSAEHGGFYIFSSPIECATAMHLNNTTLFQRLKSNGEVVYADGFTYKYYPGSRKSR